MAANALKDLGIDVVSFSNGEMAVRKIPDVRPDLILADVFMPVRDGYELCDWVKKSEQFSHIPVFLLVGAFDPLDEHRVQAVKADGIIKKPFVPPDRLITVVRSMLERVALQKQQESLKETHDHFAANVPHIEETVKLSDAEVKAMLAQGAPPPVPEPEPMEYAVRTPQIDLGDSNQSAFADMMGETSPEAPAEEVQQPAFQASSAEAPAPPMSFDIKEAQREPSPDEPPIKVDFSGPSEPMELLRDEPVAAPPSQVGRLEELVANPAEWMEQQPAAAAPPPLPSGAPVLEAELPPMPTISVEPQLPAAPEPPKPEPMGVPSLDLPGLEWHAPAETHVEPPPVATEPVMEAPPVELAPPPAPVAAAMGTPELIAAAAPVNPYVVDEIVDKVMMQLQPQIVHRITTEVGKAIESLQPRILDSLQKDVIRPLAEELLRNATRK